MRRTCFTLQVDPAAFFADGRADETRPVLDEVFNLAAQLTVAGLNGVAR
jgi:hypothetical protein